MNARFRLPLALVLGAASTAAAQETVDLAVVHRIKAEAFQSGKVMDHLFFLTDVGGPRLTASPGQRAAADWAIARLKSWGIDSARSEPWGRFGRSWQLKRFAAHQLTPTYAPLHGVPLAWSGGTRGPVTADVVLAPVFERFEDSLRADPARVAARVQEYAKQKRGKLAGRIVLIEPLRELPPATAAALSRFDDADLAKLAAAPEPEPLPPLEWPVTKLPDDPKERQRVLSTLPLEAAEDYWTRQTRAWDPLWTFLREEGVPAVLVNDAYGRDAGGTLFAEQAGFWRAGSPVPPPVVVLAAESYGRIARLAQQQHPVRLELEVAVEMQEEDRDAANVIAEIPGGTRADEVVMLGAHLDSWHSGTGATDNAAGCAVILEAMRILKALELPLARTVRLGALDGRGAGHLRLARVREAPLRRPRHDAPGARAREARGVLQRRQRDRQDPRRLPAGKRHGAADLRVLARAVRRPRRAHADDPRHRRHRSPAVRRGRAAGLPVHPGPGGLLDAHAPLGASTCTTTSRAPT